MIVRTELHAHRCRLPSLLACRQGPASSGRWLSVALDESDDSDGLSKSNGLFEVNFFDACNFIVHC